MKGKGYNMVEMQDELWMDYELILKIKVYTVCEKKREYSLFYHY